MPTMPVRSTNVMEGASLIGAMLAYPMYGTLVCQVSSYYKRFPDDLRHLKILVALILLTSTAGLIINANLIWYYCIRRGIGVDPRVFQECDHWTISEITCFLAEGLFLKRMWALSRKRYPTVLAFIPFVLGWACTIAYIQGMYVFRLPTTSQPAKSNHIPLKKRFRHWCFPDIKLNRVSLSPSPPLSLQVLPLPTNPPPHFQPYLFSSYGFRFLSDGIIAGTMCTLLYQQTSHMPTGCIRNRPNFVRIVNSLVVWTLSTGFVMWVTAVAFVLTYILFPATFISLAIYLVRGNIYANAVLALVVIMICRLHVRTRYRRVADEVISLHVQVQTVNGVGNLGGGDSDGLTRRSRS
ncbi:uncharacterized protein LACBIDRAFT_318131 [Laccaria bicolor S238N-H82]|uniref:Predicted protein n=1 Tax=Laccaria bicolor (strain S238N-H82 / ATCC MYA-4686) TaxID=486041 RepID=B0D625_LACBS|nr:uncharacterized protein LACBIDRAFT_318131 [Laccaria bicolor S238N-H82]EDR10125.1 predicted protein [Laccaria bicolor S238N-H82]|eukprot:XP_001879510.1 predicted protein [Laccaria bicolor S238N-H82]